jgi:hypothetical protein
MVHIWMVHKRLLADIPHGKDIQEALFDYLWEDTCARIRQQKVNEMSVNKHLKSVQAFSFKLCIELDQSLKNEEKEEQILDIGGAVWRAVYDRRDDVSDEQVLEFARCELLLLLFLLPPCHTFFNVLIFNCHTTDISTENN